MNTNTPQNAITTDACKPLSAPPRNAGDLLAEYPDLVGTPGQQHVRAFLPGMAPRDAEGVAHLINGGDLIACARCHFLHLPRRPFAAGSPAGAEGCDVCAHADRPNESAEHYDSRAQQTDDLPEQIAAARLARAGVLLELWWGPALDAELWLVACAEGGQ